MFTIDRKNTLLLVLFPNAPKKFRPKLRKLADEKNIDWYSPQISGILNNLANSIIRHEFTHYNECINKVGRHTARFYIQPIVEDILRKIKE